MNILFIHEVEWLKKVVYEPHCFSEALSLLGHNVYAIDYEVNWAKKGTWDFGSLRTQAIPNVSRAYSKASVTLYRPGFIKIPVISRLSAGLTHYQAIRTCIKENDIDVVVLYSVPTNGLQTVNLCRKHGIPVVFRAIDILHEMVPLYQVLSPITHLMERVVYSHVDLILTLTEQLSQYVLRMGADASNVRILPQGVDSDLFNPDYAYSVLRKELGIKEQDFVIVFMGTLFEFSGLDYFIAQLPKLLKQIPRAKLVIVGDGSQRPKLERIVSDLHLEKWVIFTGFQPYTTLPQYINLATVCINPFLVIKATSDVFPAKILQYLACGKGVIATPLPGMKGMIAGEKQGVIYANNAEEMVQAMVSLPHKLGANGLKLVKQTHSYKRIVREFESILLGLVERKKV